MVHSMEGYRPVKSGPIEWKEFKEAFLGKYLPRERREVKVEEFINLKQGNMTFKEYSLNFSMLYRYTSSLVSNPRDDMSTFMMGFADLVREECRTTMIDDDMTLPRLMVYAQSIEQYKLERIVRNLKRNGSRRWLKFKNNLGVLR